MPINSPQQMIEAIKRNLPKNTGRTFDEWVSELKKHKFMDCKEAAAWLKNEHKFGTNQANFVAGEVFGHPDYMTKTKEQLLKEQYSGAKEHLKEIYDFLDDKIHKVCPDVILDPRKTYVSMIGRSQFGIIQPSTKIRIDVGIKITGIPSHTRLQEPGSFYSDKVTKKISLSTTTDVDDDLTNWIKQAFEQNMKR